MVGFAPVLSAEGIGLRLSGRYTEACQQRPPTRGANDSIDPAIHPTKRLLRRLMDARIKSGHDGRGLAASALFRFSFQTAGHAFAFSRHDAPEFRVVAVPQKIEGARDPQVRARGRRPGARCTRGLVRKNACKSAHEHTGSAEAVRPSLRNGFTIYFVLSRATGLYCQPR